MSQKDIKSQRDKVSSSEIRYGVRMVRMSLKFVNSIKCNETQGFYRSLLILIDSKTVMRWELIVEMPPALSYEPALPSWVPLIT